MKKLLLLLFASITGFAQNPDLLSTTWYLDHLEIGGNTITPPTDGDLTGIVLSFENTVLTNYNAYTLSCDSGACQIAFPTEEQITFGSGFSWVLGGCSLANDNIFHNQYSAFFTESTAPYDYLVTNLSNNLKQLVITAPSGATALFLSKPFPEEFNILVNNEWWLTQLTLNGQDFYPPDTLPYSFALRFYDISSQYEVTMNGCELAGGASLVLYTDSSFRVPTDFAWFGDTFCPDNTWNNYSSMYNGFFLPGTYQYAITDLTPLCGCPTATYALALTSPSGNIAYYTSNLLSNPDFAAPSVSVSPNPASDFVDLRLGSVQQGLLTVSDMTGRVIRTQSVGASEHLDVADLSTGIYLFTVNTPSGTATQKVAIR